MKKNKKAIALMSAAVLSCASLTVLGADAIYGLSGSDDFLKGYRRIENVENDVFSVVKHGEYSKFYVKPSGDVESPGDGCMNCKVVYNTPSFFEITVPESTDREALWNTIGEVCPDYTYDLVNVVTPENTLKFKVSGYKGDGVSDEEHNTKNLTLAQVRQINDTLKEKGFIESFEFFDYNYCWTEAQLSNPFPYHLNGKTREVLEAYFNENGVDFSIKANAENPDGTYFAYVSIDLVIDEAYGLVNRIAEDTGVKPVIVTLADAHDHTGASIDLYNAVPGDADCDGIVKMNDAVLIMQTISNPDKYSLTPQGVFNGDTANPGDGITPLDAAAVQNMLLGLSY